jgi:hypothetical protein
MTSHSNATTVHRPYTWEYDDATEREASTGFVAGDVGRLARQLDDNSLWMLTDDDPETWVQVGGGGSGYDEGTSFPGSPATGDKFYRTDRNLLYYYDGTRWLTVTLYIGTYAPGDTTVPPFSAASAAIGYTLPDPDYGTYLVDFQAVTGVYGTNDGSNYWTIEFRRRNAANTGASITSFDTSGDTASNWVHHDVAINAVLDATAKLIEVQIAKVGGPANLYCSPRFTYRLIG